MSDNVNAPAHYCTGKYECIEVMHEAFGIEAVKHFMLLNSFKYLWRTDRKNGTEDIEKAERYLSMYLNLNGKEPPVKTDHDKMTLATAFEIPQAWMMVWAGEPDRKIDVTMTYEDLKIIYEMVKKEREKREHLDTGHGDARNV